MSFGCSIVKHLREGGGRGHFAPFAVAIQSLWRTSMVIKVCTKLPTHRTRTAPAFSSQLTPHHSTLDRLLTQCAIGTGADEAWQRQCCCPFASLFQASSGPALCFLIELLSSQGAAGQYGFGRAARRGLSDTSCLARAREQEIRACMAYTK